MQTAHRLRSSSAGRARALFPPLLLLLGLALLLAACEDNDDVDPVDPETPTPTPAVTPTPTPTPEPTPAPAEASLPDDPRVGLELVANGLTAPVDVAAPDDGTGRLFVVEQTGTIRIVSAQGERMDEPFLDLGDRIVELQEGFDERGLLGLAFHPDFANNGRFAVYYSAPAREGAPAGWDHTSHVSEFTVSEDDENVADPDSERLILQIDQPAFNHNAGHLRFGPDGYLYIPLGDGGGAGDVGEGHTPDIGNAQDRTNLLGSVLRIDVDDEGGQDRAYGIPEDNPFVDEDDAEPEIWVYGLRNPFDISFDPDGEHGLLIADAGQDLFEWVNLAEGGENFGWNITEGSHCFDPQNPTGPIPEECPDEGPFGEPLVDPVVEYAREDFGTVIVGAHIYRGSALEEYQGVMIVADWSIDGNANGVLFVAAPSGDQDANGMWERTQLEIVTDEPGAVPGTIAQYITAIGRDADGELYVLANPSSGPAPEQGAVYRVVPANEE